MAKSEIRQCSAFIIFAAKILSIATGTVFSFMKGEPERNLGNQHQIGEPTNVHASKEPPSQSSKIQRLIAASLRGKTYICFERSY